MPLYAYGHLVLLETSKNPYTVSTQLEISEERQLLIPAICRRTCR